MKAANTRSDGFEKTLLSGSALFSHRNGFAPLKRICLVVF